MLKYYSIAPDRYFKYYISGGGPYVIEVPSTAIDGKVYGGVLNDAEDPPTFVQYLRVCMRFAGFPGMAVLDDPPLADIAQLTAGFKPF